MGPFCAILKEMTRLLLCLGIFVKAAAPAAAQSLTADQVLEKSRAAYAALKSVHIVAERFETTSAISGPSTGISECELAVMPGSRYYARFKIPNVEAVVVSDGSNIWRELVSRRLWTKVSAAALEQADDEEETPAAAPKDLHDTLMGVLLSHYQSLAKSARDASIAKEEDFKLDHDKLRCYLVRAHNDQLSFELLVDEQSFLVVRGKEVRKSPQGMTEVTTKLKRLDVNQAVDASLFSFAPPPGWTEVENLALPGEQHMLLAGERAANFTLKTLDGEPVTLGKLQGKVVVLDFWATWCGPCRMEMPSIEKLRAEFGAAVQFYGVNQETSAKVNKFVHEQNYQMPVLMDSRHEVHMLYGVRAIPTLLIIGPDGVIRRQFVGTRGESALRNAIQSVVNGKS